jgi:hypothetical protein
MFEDREADREMLSRSSRLRDHPSLQPVKRKKNFVKKGFFLINVTVVLCL